MGNGQWAMSRFGFKVQTKGREESGAMACSAYIGGVYVYVCMFVSTEHLPMYQGISGSKY